MDKVQNFSNFELVYKFAAFSNALYSYVLLGAKRTGRNLHKTFCQLLFARMRSRTNILSATDSGVSNCNNSSEQAYTTPTSLLRGHVTVIISIECH
jgi:hypothetical protein